MVNKEESRIMGPAQPGANNLLTDVAGLRVGNAQNLDVRTGVTAIIFDKPAICAAAVAGGGPGTRETDLLQAGTLVDSVDAVVLSGGSSYGLAAADGVAAALGADGRGYGLVETGGVPKSPIVPGAILYDLANGGDKNWGRNPPYRELGMEAYDKAGDTFNLGRVGAGIGARAGNRTGGLGSASIQNGMITVGAIAAVNCFGSATMPGTDVFWSWPFEENQEFGGARPAADFAMDANDTRGTKLDPQPGQNTTIACIATDARLSPYQAQRVADMALSGFSRAILPVFTPFDGDAVFVIATGTGADLRDQPALILSQLGEFSASTLARSIARGVFEAGSGKLQGS